MNIVLNLTPADITVPIEQGVFHPSSQKPLFAVDCDEDGSTADQGTEDETAEFSGTNETCTSPLTPSHGQGSL